MAAPTNISAGTAVDITSLPYSVVQTVDDAGTTYTVYYAHTATVTGLLSVFGFGDLAIYQPSLTVYLGAAGTVQYLQFSAVGPNKAIQMPVTVGLTYVFKFTPNGGNPTPAVLTLTASLLAQSTAPIGSILVNDDTDGYPAILIGTDGSILQALQGIVAGEAGDLLDNGVVALWDQAGTPGDTIAIYDSNWSLLTSVTGLEATSAFGCLRTCLGTQRFWLAKFESGPIRKFQYLEEDGTLGPEHTFTPTATVSAIAAANDESILYHCATGNTVAIRQWDLNTDTALADLVAARANYSVPDLLVLSDDTLLVLYVKTSATIDVEVLHYSAAGAVLHTYNFGSTHTFPGSTVPRLAYGADATTFWIWTHPTTGDSTFLEVTVSSGAIATTVTTKEYEQGVYQSAATATPASLFGHSFSCPFLVTRTGFIPPPSSNLNGPAALAAFEADGTLRDYRLVWSRRAPHLADEAQRVFYSKFQLDLEAGVGTVEGQGVIPTCELRWSNDGGFTWSGWRQLQMGAQGHYRWRAIARRLGSARDRVFEVRGSDPVKVALLQAYLDVTEGTA